MKILSKDLEEIDEFLACEMYRDEKKQITSSPSFKPNQEPYFKYLRLNKEGYCTCCTRISMIRPVYIYDENGVHSDLTDSEIDEMIRILNQPWTHGWAPDDSGIQRDQSTWMNMIIMTNYEYDGEVSPIDTNIPIPDYNLLKKSL